MASLSDRARAEADRRGGFYFDMSGFMEGVEWAEKNIRSAPWEDPTDAEVEAATDAMRDWELENIEQLSHGEIREGLARAALVAARNARRAEG